MTYVTHEEMNSAVINSKREVLELVRDVLFYSDDFEEFKGNLLEKINENLPMERDDKYSDKACGVRDGGIISCK